MILIDNSLCQSVTTKLADIISEKNLMRFYSTNISSIKNGLQFFYIIEYESYIPIREKYISFLNFLINYELLKTEEENIILYSYRKIVI